MASIKRLAPLVISARIHNMTMNKTHWIIRLLDYLNILMQAWGDEGIVSAFGNKRYRQRCRLILSWGWRRSQGSGCSPVKRVRELGSERRKTVRSLSSTTVRDLRGVVPSTRGLGWGNPWCAGCWLASQHRRVARFLSDNRWKHLSGKHTSR